TGNYRKAAAELAVAEINQSGLLDKKLELAAEDDETDPDKGVAAAERLRQSGVVAIIGSAASSVTIKAAEQVSIPNDILQVSPSSTSPLITSVSDNGLLWRTAPSDVYQGKIAASYAKGTLGKTTAGIIYVDNAYGQGLAGAFKAEFEKAGGTVLSSVPYQALKDTEVALHDFTSAVSTLMTGNPELVYLVSYYLDGAKITLAMKQHVTASYKPLLMGVDGNYGSVFLANADADVVEGMVGTAPSPPLEDVNYKTFSVNYKAMYGLEPPIYTANTYDAVYLLAYAMLKANSTASRDVAARLLEVSREGEAVNVAQFADGKAKIAAGTDINYEGASGKVDFDESGDITSGSYLIWKVANNEFASETMAEFSDSGITMSQARAIFPLLSPARTSALCSQL
ncbi:MAG TPA: ABC transporter substrate-binding protein, partial [Nitrospirota bacterium]